MLARGLADQGRRVFQLAALIAVFAVCFSLGSLASAADLPAVDDFLVDEFGKSRLWDLDVPRTDVEAVVAEFMNAYNAGDPERLAKVLEKKVVTEHGEQKSQSIIDEYGEHFLATTARYLNLRNARWQKTSDGVMTEVDFSLREQSKLDGKDRDYSGAVRFYMNNTSGRWRINQLYFAYNPAPESNSSHK